MSQHSWEYYRESPWVRTADRLPEPGRRVIVCSPEGRQGFARVEGDRWWDDDRGFGVPLDYCPDWMYPPAPPESPASEPSR